MGVTASDRLGVPLWGWYRKRGSRASAGGGIGAAVEQSTGPQTELTCNMRTREGRAVSTPTWPHMRKTGVGFVTD